MSLGPTVVSSTQTSHSAAAAGSVLWVEQRNSRPSPGRHRCGRFGQLRRSGRSLVSSLRSDPLGL
jgi:hypothetical protein